jgi:predicted ATP-grasp superfamily ATP-dependent carboligase
MCRKNGITRSYPKGGNKMSNLIKANQIKPTGVVLTQNEKRGIEAALKQMTRDQVLKTHAKRPNQWDEFDYVVSLNGMDLDKLAIALYRPEDITIQQTIEEQLLDYFEIQQKAQSAMQDRTEVAVKKVLNIIGMKVKGINE